MRTVLCRPLHGAAVPALLVLAMATTAQAAQQRDTLVYDLAVVPRRAQLMIEARLTRAEPGAVVLAAPPGSGPAGTTVAGLTATDDGGSPLAVRRTGSAFTIEPASSGAIRFRYRLSFQRRVAEGSTGAALDSTRLYAATRSVFVAPEPATYRKTSRAYPIVRVRFAVPAGWSLVTGWESEAGEHRPASGEDLLGATIAAAADFRIYLDTVAGKPYLLAIRGRRYFTDSALVAVVQASLRRGVAAFGPIPAARVTYTSELGRKGRSSGSLEGVASIGLVWEPSELLELPRSHDTFHETLHLWFGGAIETERWWTEGVTDYFAARLYAEWRQRPEDLAALCYESYKNYLAIEHRTRMTMADENRRHVGGDNTELLVYRKGMLAGLLLDAAIRRATAGRATLDHAARRLLAMAAERSSRRVRDSEIRSVVVEVGGGGTVARLWDRVVGGVSQLAQTEITEALRDVTGHTLDPPGQPKRRKVLRVAPHR